MVVILMGPGISAVGVDVHCFTNPFGSGLAGAWIFILPALFLVIVSLFLLED